MHRRERRAQIDQLLRRGIEFSAFVIRADDEDAHVPRVRGLDRRPVQVVDEIPVDIDVIEFAASIASRMMSVVACVEKPT